MTSIESTGLARRAHPSTAVEALQAAALGAPVSPTRGTARGMATSFIGAPRKAGGMSVRERFATLEQRFKPEAAKGVDVKLQFKLSGADGGEWYVVVKDGKITVKEGTGPDADATVRATASDYKKMAEGDMNKTIAFLRGKLKIDGDRKYLEKWETWFKES